MALSRRRVAPDARERARSPASRSRAQRALPARVLSQGQRRRIGLARLALSRGRCGSSTSRRPRSTPTARRSSRSWSREHLDAGGIAVAATHQPLDLAGAHVDAGAVLTLRDGDAPRCPLPRTSADAAVLPAFCAGRSRATSRWRCARGRNSRAAPVLRDRGDAVSRWRSAPEPALLAALGPGVIWVARCSRRCCRCRGCSPPTTPTARSSRSRCRRIRCRRWCPARCSRTG